MGMGANTHVMTPALKDYLIQPSNRETAAPTKTQRQTFLKQKTLCFAVQEWNGLRLMWRRASIGRPQSHKKTNYAAPKPTHKRNR